MKKYVIILFIVSAIVLLGLFVFSQYSNYTKRSMGQMLIYEASSAVDQIDIRLLKSHKLNIDEIQSHLNKENSQVQKINMVDGGFQLINTDQDVKVTLKYKIENNKVNWFCEWDVADNIGTECEQRFLKQ